MKITSVNIPGLPKLGLKPIKMDRLGKVVVLAGQNGAGKTRLLNRLFLWDHEKLPGTTLTRPRFFERFWAFGDHRNRFKQLPQNGWWRCREAWEAAIQNYHEVPSGVLEALYSDLYEVTFDSPAAPQIIHFVPTGLLAADPSSSSPSELRRQAQEVKSLGILNLERNALARIQVLQDRRWNATHPHSSVAPQEKEEDLRNYEGLRTTVERFLGTTLGRSRDGEATLFGLPIGNARLSHGQSVLLQFCVAIHAQAEKLSELIVLMDEPENHLHPGAMLDVIHEIEKALTNGQIWIATHSVPLLSSFDPDSIWWMEGGTVHHAGSEPERILRGLIGDEDRIEKLSDFLGLPAALATNNFAHQCLLTPTVSGPDNDDPQARQIQKTVESIRPGERLRVLDFGAGRGRLVSALREGGQTAEEVLRRIDYWAYENSGAHRTECEAAIARLYGDTSQRYLASEGDARSRLDSQSVDVVVMCNVLHEIDPLDWLALFDAKGLVRHLLKPDGYLLLVEDTEMRVGEKAHGLGFLVLDTPEIKALFAVREKDTQFVVDDARGDGRLKAHLIPAECVARVTRRSVKDSVEQVRHLALEAIKGLRAKEAAPSYRAGRKHAFHAQQFTNAQLALEQLGD